MAAPVLKKLLGREIRPVLEALLARLPEPLAILEMNGVLLFGTHPTQEQGAGDPVAVLSRGLPVGQVVGLSGSPWPEALAALLAYLIAKEGERKDLATEVLDNYRELHLLYRLSEKLFVYMEPEAIAHTMLHEVGPLVQVEAGLVALRSSPGDDLELVASFKSAHPLKSGVLDPENLIGRVIQTGIAEIANYLPADDFFLDLPGRMISLLCAPLVTEKQKLGVIVLVSDGSRQFTANDLKLVTAVSRLTAPAIDIAYFHQVELEKARLERDLQTARQVQAGLLPDVMPVLKGWKVSAHWQPAREVGGDFYEFIRFPDGKLCLAIADVTDKGVPAALMMANTRSVLRAVAGTARQHKLLSPAKLLARVNNLLCEDMPVKMFVTCLLVILDPVTGHIRYANAGHNLAFLRKADDVIEMRATGVPLGLFEGWTYEDKDLDIELGDSILMYSDGLVEAHNAGGEMFGMGRLRRLLAYPQDGPPLHGDHLIRFLMAQLAGFTGPAWEQEDDVTLVTLERCAAGLDEPVHPSG